MTAIVDLFPQYLRRGYRKEMFTAFVCVIWFLIGLSMVTEVLTHISVLCLQQDHFGEQNYNYEIIIMKCGKQPNNSNLF